MKFSYSLIKKLVPWLKSKKDLIEKLNLHSFEAVDSGGDAFDVSLPPNRYSDAASHWGMAREISAVMDADFKIKNGADLKIKNSGNLKAIFKIEVKDKKNCFRYAAGYFENVKIGSSPKWMQKILIHCGLRPINGAVDIMNYAMLETGQPLHVFDCDKLKAEKGKPKTIIVRRAKKGEKMTALDRKICELDGEMTVIADSKNVLAVAGVKGGKAAEVDENTKKIIVEAANFDSVSIYKTSKKLKMATDASIRFSRDISPELVGFGLNRASDLLKRVCGAVPGGAADFYFEKPSRKIVKFDAEKFRRFIGADMDRKTIAKIFANLGFKIIKNKQSDSAFFVEIPSWRRDIETFEDLTEEAIRIYGYNRLPSVPPAVRIIPSGFEDLARLKSSIGDILAGFGLDEVHNYSIVGKCGSGRCLELENPLSRGRSCLRDSLLPVLSESAENNLRFFDEVKIFEIGKVFYDGKPGEILKLGIALVSKNKPVFFELKGMVDELLKKIGLVDYIFVPQKDDSLAIESDGEKIGELKIFGSRKTSLAEFNLEKLLDLISGERQYRPLPKFPSAMRDISVLVRNGAKIGDLMAAIQETDLENIEDVDLMDEYKNSFTFRIVFQSPDKTLTEKEINQKMEKIAFVLKNKFRVVIR